MQDEQCRLYGSDYANLNLVFARPDGQHHNPDKLGVRIRRVMQSAGLTGVSLHSLRHSHASELLSKGAPITAVAERLGHASPNITLGICSHAFADGQSGYGSVVGHRDVGGDRIELEGGGQKPDVIKCYQWRS